MPVISKEQLLKNLLNMSFFFLLFLMSATPLPGWDTRMVRHKGTFSRYFIHLPSLSYNSLANGCEIFHNSAFH